MPERFSTNTTSNSAKKIVETADIDEAQPLRLWDGHVLPAWIDYNGHMTEFRYAQVFSDTCEALLKLVNLYTEYGEQGFSYYTAESHAQFFDEAAVNETIYTTAQIVFADAKRLHVYYRMHAGADDRLLASLEIMYLHVHMESGRVVAAEEDAVAALLRIAAAHSNLAKPKAVGRYVGQR